MSVFYKAFGLVIRSDFALESLEPHDATDDQADLYVIRSEGIVRDPNPPVDPFFDIRPGVQYMHWWAIGGYLIERDDTVRVEPHAGVSDHLVSQALLGLVMSIVLERHQLLCLHAGAVNVQDRAVVFLGDKGAGKSTTSGAMLARGHLPITDDLVAVENLFGEDPHPTIRPGFSCMKLWPDTLEALNLETHEDDRLIHPQTTKIQKRLPLAIPDRNVSASAAFVLRRDPDVAETHAVRLPQHEALQMVLRYTFMARYGESRLGRDHLVLHMRRCAAFVAKVPVYELRICADLGKLERLADRIAQITAQEAA